MQCNERDMQERMREWEQEKVSSVRSSDSRMLQPANGWLAGPEYKLVSAQRVPVRNGK